MSELLSAIRRAEIANKGKSEEHQVEKILSELKAKFSNFDFARRPDARACMGRIKPQPSDFECLIDGHQIEIEVKSTKAVNTLPYKNLSQLGMLRRKRMCHASVILLVYRAKVGAWCMPDFDVILETYDPDHKASWDISTWKTYDSVGELLVKALGFTDKL